MQSYPTYRKIEQNLNKFQIFKLDYDCIEVAYEEAKTQVGSLQEEFTIRSFQTKHVDNQKYQVTFSYPY